MSGCITEAGEADELKADVAIISHLFQGFYLAGALLLLIKIFLLNDTRLVDPAIGIGVALCLVPLLLYTLKGLQWIILKAYRLSSSP